MRARPLTRTARDTLRLARPEYVPDRKCSGHRPLLRVSSRVG